MRSHPHIESIRLLARLGTPEDAGAMASFLKENREHLQPFTPVRDPIFFTTAYWQQEFPKRQSLFQKNLDVKFLLFLKDGNDLVGVANYNNVVRGAFQACHLGYSLGSDKQGQGLMTEALQATIQYIFKDYGLHRIMANYMPDNHRSAKLLQALGFVIEGEAKQYLLIHNEWKDHVLTSLTNDDWQASEE